MVGLLPAEEITLNHALTASLMSSSNRRQIEDKDKDSSDKDRHPREQPACENREKIGTSKNSSSSFPVTVTSDVVGTGRESRSVSR